MKVNDHTLEKLKCLSGLVRANTLWRVQFQLELLKNHARTIFRNLFQKAKQFTA